MPASEIEPAQPVPAPVHGKGGKGGGKGAMAIAAGGDAGQQNHISSSLRRATVAPCAFPGAPFETLYVLELSVCSFQQT